MQALADRFGLNGKVALVIGASSGLGREAALALASAGADVGLIARREERLLEVGASCSELGVRTANVAADVTHRNELAGAVADIDSQLGSIDILLYAAGIAPLKRAETHPDDKWEAAVQTNLNGAFYAAQIVGQQMIERATAPDVSWSGGRIIMISSIMGSHGNPVHRNIGYSASKGGLDNMVRQLAVEWAQYGITTNAVAPAYFKTEMTIDPSTGEIPAEMEERMRLFSPMGRIGESGELDSSILFLASPASSYVNGVILPIDGGWSAW